MKRFSDNPDTTFRLLCHHSPDAVLLIGLNGEILHANPAAYHQFGFSNIPASKANLRSHVKNTEDWEDIRHFMESDTPDFRLYGIELVKKNRSSFFADLSLAKIDGIGNSRLAAAFIRDVTEFHSLLSEKKKNEILLMDILNAIGEGLSLLDKDLNIVRVNSWMERMYRHRLPLVGKKCYMAYQQRETPCPWCPTLKTLKTGVPHTEVVPYPSEKNPAGWMELFAYPLRDLTGEITGVVEDVRDITQQKRLRDQLIESEKKFRIFFENSAVFAYITTRDGEIIEINQAALNLLGYTPEEFSKLKAWDLYPHPEERGRFIEEIERNGSVEDFLIHLRCKDGRILSCRDTAILLRDPQGKPARYQGIIRDVTEEEKRIQELNRLRTLIEQADAEIVVTDIDGKIEYVNPAFERITGYSQKEAIGQNPRILKSGKHDEAFYKTLWSTLTGGKVWHGRFVNRKKDGSFYHEEAHIFPIFNNEGNIVNYAAIKRDITREILLEEQLQQAAKLEAIGQLVGGIAHDFNNILTSIQGFTEIALSKISPQQPLWDELTEIRSSAHQATRITQQLLSFSRKQMIAPKHLSGNQIIREMVPLLRRYIGEDIQLMTTLTEKRDVILADRGQVEQCLLNLVINARDAIKERKEKHVQRLITIETDLITIEETYLQTHVDVAKGDYFLIMVSDTGIGMDNDTLVKIFDPFFTTKSEGKGTGLGCSTVFGIVKQNGGAVHAYSEQGAGTTVKIYWPLASGEIQKKEEKETEVPHEMPQPAGFLTGQETILIVEDDDAIRRLVTHALEAAGYTTFAAESGDKAIALLREKKPPIDLLFTDIIMSGMTGDELAAILQAENPELKVLFSSGYTQNHILKNGVLKPGTHFLHKPYTIRDLLRKIREVLDG